MSLCSAGVRVARRAVRKVETPIADIPTFLCPGILRAGAHQKNNLILKPQFFKEHSQRRRFGTPTRSDVDISQRASKFSLGKLPRQCPGCGAFSQAVDKQEPGFYTTTRKSVKSYLGDTISQYESVEDVVIKAALENAREAVANLDLGSFSKPCESKTPILPKILANIL